MWTVYLIVLYLRQKLLSALNLRVLPHDSDKTLERVQMLVDFF